MLGSHNKFVSLDYDRREVRLVSFEYAHGQPVILSMHASAVPAGLDVNDPVAFGAHLKELVEKLKLGGAGAFLAVGRAQAVLKSLTLPAGCSEEELPNMVSFQVGKELPFGTDEAITDFTLADHWDSGPAEEGQEGQTVLVAAVRLPVVNAAHQLCTEAGLVPMRLGLRPYANLRSVYRCVQVTAGEKVLLVNLTAEGAEIDVLCDGSLEFSRQAGVNIPDKLDPARAQAVGRVVAEVVRSLQSFHTMEQPGAIGGCLVAGHTGLEAAVVKELTAELSVKVEMLDVANGYSVQGGQEVSAFSAALGLCSVDSREPLPFDFFTPKRPRPPRNTRRRNRLLIGAAAAVVLGIIVICTQLAVGARQKELATLREENKKLTDTNKQLKPLAARVGEIKKWSGSNTSWLDHLAHLSNILPSADQLFLKTFAAADEKQIRLEGQSRTPLTVVPLNHDGYTFSPVSSISVTDPLGYVSGFKLQVLLSKPKPEVATSQPVGRPGPEAPATKPAGGGPPSPGPGPTGKEPAKTAQPNPNPGGTPAPPPNGGNGGKRRKTDGGGQ